MFIIKRFYRIYETMLTCRFCFHILKYILPISLNFYKIFKSLTLKWPDAGIGFLVMVFKLNLAAIYVLCVLNEEICLHSLHLLFMFSRNDKIIMWIKGSTLLSMSAYFISRSVITNEFYGRIHYVYDILFNSITI